MAGRRSVPQKPERPQLTAQQKARCIERIRTRIAELNEFDPATIQQEHGDPQVKALEVSIKTALATAFGEDTNEYNRYRNAAFLDRAPIRMSSRSSLIEATGGYSGFRGNNFREAIQVISQAKAGSLALLNQAVRTLEEEIEDMQLIPTTAYGASEAISRPQPYIHVSGENSRININSHDQSINTVNIQASDFEPLANELNQLRQALMVRATSASEHMALGMIAAAELGAEEQSQSKVSAALSSLGAAGAWVLNVAKDIGTGVASSVIAAHLA